MDPARGCSSQDGSEALEEAALGQEMGMLHQGVLPLGGERPEACLARCSRNRSRRRNGSGNGSRGAAAAALKAAAESKELVF